MRVCGSLIICSHLTLDLSFSIQDASEWRAHQQSYSSGDAPRRLSCVSPYIRLIPTAALSPCEGRIIVPRCALERNEPYYSIIVQPCPCSPTRKPPITAFKSATAAKFGPITAQLGVERTRPLKQLEPGYDSVPRPSATHRLYIIR